MLAPLDWIARYGYAALFVLLAVGILGLPVPDETLLTFVGYLIWRGQMDPVASLVTALAGAVCGITLSFLLGRGLGRVLLERGWILRRHQHELERVQRWYQRWGRWLLLVGYFIPGVRHLTAYLAGASAMPVWSFAVAAYTGALLWTTTFILLGYWLGEQWTRATARGPLLAAAGVALVVLGAVVLWQRLRNRRRA